MPSIPPTAAPALRDRILQLPEPIRTRTAKEVETFCTKVGRKAKDWTDVDCHAVSMLVGEAEASIPVDPPHDLDPRWDDLDNPQKEAARIFADVNGYSAFPIDVDFATKDAQHLQDRIFDAVVKGRGEIQHLFDLAVHNATDSQTGEVDTKAARGHFSGSMSIAAHFHDEDILEGLRSAIAQFGGFPEETDPEPPVPGLAAVPDSPTNPRAELAEQVRELTTIVGHITDAMDTLATTVAACRDQLTAIELATSLVVIETTTTES